MFSGNYSKNVDQFIQRNSGSDISIKATLESHRTNIINQALFNLGLSSKWVLTPDQVNQLTVELERILYFTGEGVPLFADTEFVQAPEGLDEKEQLKIDVDNLLKFLLIGTAFNYTALSKKSIIDSVFKQRNPEVMKLMREGFQEIFNNMDLNLLNSLNQNGRRQFKFQLANILALYTFSDPFQQQHLVFPQESNGKWQMVKFQIETIELKPKKKLYPEIYKLYADDNGNVYNDDNRVYAYGLSPVAVNDVSPYLLFMGTPPETGQGHKFAALTDFVPGHSVGEAMYKSNRNRLAKWINKVTNENTPKIRVTGQSLGATLSLMLALDQHRYVERVDALCPAGLYKKTLDDPLFVSWDQLSADQKPKVMLHLQQYDRVKHVGYFKADWQLIKLFPKKHEMVMASYLAHIRSFANQAGAIALNVDPEQENNRWIRSAVTGVKKFFDSSVHGMLSKKIEAENAKLLEENKAKIS